MMAPLMAESLQPDKIGEAGMENYLVSFYKEGSSKPLHQVLVNGENDLSILKAAKDHFEAKKTPPEEMASYTVISHRQGTIDGIEVI
jgi:hypothetical protein